MVFAVILWIICAIIGLALLDSRGRAGTGFALGFFLGPLGLIIAAIMRLEHPTPESAQPHGRASAEPRDEERKCPECAEWIKREARKCRFCGSVVEPMLADDFGTGPNPDEAREDAPIEEPGDSGFTRAIGPVFLLLIVGPLATMFIVSIWRRTSPTVGSVSSGSSLDTQTKESKSAHPVGKSSATGSKQRSAVKLEGESIDSERVLIDSLATSFDSLWKSAVDMGQLEERPKLLSGEADNGALTTTSGNGGAFATIMFVVASDGRVAAVRIRDGSKAEFSRDAFLAVARRTYAPGLHLGAAVPVRMVQMIRAAP